MANTVDNRKAAIGSEYRINNYVYPMGLGSNPDLQHYVTFYINIRGKSRMATEGNKNDYFTVANTITGQNRLDPKDAGKALPRTVGVMGLGATALASGKKFLSGDVKGAGKSAMQGALATSAVAGTLNALQKTPLLKPDQTYRLRDVITLHLEERPSVKYSANYQNKELGVLAGMLAGGGSATDSSKTGGGISEYLALAGASMAKIPGIVGATSINNLVQASAKVTTNPFREVFFESVDFRTFNFRYHFYPTSEEETRNVQNIIQMFKEHMHPELSANGLFYIYPSEFEIKYYYRDTENVFVNKISTCALADMQVEYGGEQVSSFRDGSPVEYTVTLTFRELETMTRDRVQEGY